MPQGCVFRYTRVAKARNLASKKDSKVRTHALFTVNPIKLETGLRPNSAGIPYTLLIRIEAIGFPTFGLLLY